MTSSRPERRLAAILAADVVGYSGLVEGNEAATLRRLAALRTGVIGPLLAEHCGRLVKLMGDGLLAEFASVVDAVACAVAMQAHGRPCHDRRPLVGIDDERRGRPWCSRKSYIRSGV
jgi:class 3 adenylate cyclase